MINKQLNILEKLSTVSLFDEETARGIWQQLLQTTNKNDLPRYEQKNIRKILSLTNKFADCTAISK